MSVGHNGLWKAPCNLNPWKFSDMVTTEYNYCPYCGKPLEADNGKDDS
jgi:hypothetical protein